jgi:hypothetical protein
LWKMYIYLPLDTKIFKITKFNLKIFLELDLPLQWVDPTLHHTYLTAFSAKELSTILSKGGLSGIKLDL